MLHRSLVVNFPFTFRICYINTFLSLKKEEYIGVRKMLIIYMNIQMQLLLDETIRKSDQTYDLVKKKTI